jgi:arsenate reductase
MAEGLLRSIGGKRYAAFSAGTHPTEVNPLAVEAMSEIDIDISGHSSESVEAYVDRRFDYVVTVCQSARESCPFIPALVRNIHRTFDDPSAAAGSHEERLAVFRRVRDEIQSWMLAEFSDLQ